MKLPEFRVFGSSVPEDGTNEQRHTTKGKRS